VALRVAFAAAAEDSVAVAKIRPITTDPIRERRILCLRLMSESTLAQAIWSDS